MRKTPLMVALHDRLFIRGHTLHVAPESMLSVLQRHHVGLVMCVALRRDDGLANAARLVGITYRHEPMSDSRVIEDTRVQVLAAEIAAAMKDTGVLVHCDAGRNRSALVALLALRIVTGQSAQDVIASARAIRPSVLANKSFERFVLGQHCETARLF